MTRGGDERRISYRLTNEDSADPYVLNRVPEHDGPGEVTPELSSFEHTASATLAQHVYCSPPTPVN